MSLKELISIDSYGWIERFTNGPKAAQYNKIIDSCEPKEIVTSIVVLFEVYKKIKKLKGEEEALLAVAALSQTTIVLVDQTIALEAADYSLEKNLHFSDALVYATARHYKVKLYTSDDDLGELNSVCSI
jgi:predicted nucleic acid-binding protein